MSEWQPIETLVRDGRQVEYKTRNGEEFKAPASPPIHLTKAEQREEARKIYEHSGDWPNIGFTPTHWREDVDNDKAS